MSPPPRSNDDDAMTTHHDGPSTLRATRVALLVLAVAIPLASSGCGVPVIAATAGITAAQVGASEYAHGDLESAHAASFEAVYVASIAAIEDMGFLKVNAGIGERVATIRAQDVGGRSITIEMKRRTAVVTTMGIRIGVFGDQPLSRLVLGNIQARLPAVPMTPVEEEPAP